jgi:hypothetical protein|tara:strand:+ start:1042 stop:1818 length:777 start_codon:yes stop_codon:yes gene_type:complete
MAITIEQEANALSKLVTDIDNTRRRYTKTEDDTLINFVSPYFFIYQKHRFYLLKNSVRKTLDPKFKYRPDYLSHEEYGTTTLWTLILFINDIPNIESFDQNQVLVPTFQSILQLARNNDEFNKISDLNELNKEPVAKTTLNLYTTKSKPKIEDFTIVVPEPAEEIAVHYVRQKFDITFVDAANKYVDLGFDEAIAESIELSIKGQTAVIYGEDYTLKDDPNGVAKRLSWAIDVTNGITGLESIIIEDSTIEVRYAIEQ